MTQTVLLTGATSTIGSEIAKSLSANGYRLVLIGRNEEKLSHIVNNLPCGQNFSFQFDNQNLENAKSLFQTISNEVGEVNHMVVCSGFHKLKPLRVSKPADFSQSHLLNTESAFIFSKHFSSNLFKTAEVRSIVYISSIAAISGEAGLTAYSSAKAGLIAGAKCLAIELAPKNIRVNCISPGWVNTESTLKVIAQLGKSQVAKIKNSYPLGFGEPIDVANLVEFLISEKSRWITGQNIIIDGGKTIS